MLQELGRGRGLDSHFPMCFNLSLNKASSDTAGLLSLVPGRGKTPLRASGCPRPGEVGQGCPHRTGAQPTLPLEEGSKEKASALTGRELKARRTPGFKEHFFPHPSLTLPFSVKRVSGLVCTCGGPAPAGSQLSAPLTTLHSGKALWWLEISHDGSVYTVEATRC